MIRGESNAMTDRLLIAGISRSQAGIPITRLGPYGARAPVPAQRPGSRADEALAKIYQEQSSPLTRLAALLIWAAVCPPGVGAIPGAIGEIAEGIVHDALAAMHREWHRLRDAEQAIAYLRRAIVHEARAHGRAPRASQDAGAAVGKDGGLSAMSAGVLEALRRLPGRQREALVLRYYADLPEAAAADAMGVTRAAFRGHAARGMIALRLLLDQGP
ncbi:MAG: SigE family polymerase sigma factor [Actinomycetia bacterium]|nr:SigE family polymerase sigma factor [Actinomycetes bacterium]